MREENELSKVAYQVGELGVQVDFLTNALLATGGMEFGEEEAILKLFVTIGEKLQDVCTTLNDMSMYWPKVAELQALSGQEVEHEI